jgi:hypothetical protein
LNIEAVSFRAKDSMREIAGIRIPDSRLAVAALDLVKIESRASIYKHVLRTFVFGGLAAWAERIGFDEELFFLGAALHDLGLTERFGAPVGRDETPPLPRADPHPEQS